MATRCSICEFLYGPIVCKLDYYDADRAFILFLEGLEVPTVAYLRGRLAFLRRLHGGRR